MHAHTQRPPKHVVTTGSVPVDVKAAVPVSFCTCGQSAKFPLCDGAHKAYNAAHGTSFKPSRVESDADKTLRACVCGHSAKKPLCDGTHKKVKA
jgi:CDGSH-type Zn-finger protein